MYASIMNIKTRINTTTGEKSYQVVLERGKSTNGKRLREYKTFSTLEKAQEYLNLRKEELSGDSFINEHFSEGGSVLPF